jgi:transcriptional regulator with PAS, ATPase and Fis domain
VRELRTAIEHGVVMSNDDVIDITHLPSFITEKPTSIVEHGSAEKNTLAPPADFNLHLLEANAIRSALAQTGDNRTHAAKLLGISRRTLQRKIKEVGL